LFASKYGSNNDRNNFEEQKRDVSIITVALIERKG
jgi:hypothetical protein